MGTIIFKDSEPILKAARDIAEFQCLEKDVSTMHEMLEGYMGIAPDDDWRRDATRLAGRIIQLFIAINKNIKED